MEFILGKRFLTVFIALFSFSVFSQDARLGDRINVMECSHEEVVAYLELPDAGRNAMLEYDNWQGAFMSQMSVKSENDPSACIGVLYGDLAGMGENLKKATDAFLSDSPLLNMSMAQMMESLKGSICGRMQGAVETVDSRVSDAIDAIENKAYQELENRYGQKVFESFVTDALIEDEYQSMGLKYRNEQVQTDAFRNSVRNKWKRQLEELVE